MDRRYRYYYLVDLQGIKSDANTFIVKEIASYHVHDKMIVANVFRDPCSWKSLDENHKFINPWLFYNFHPINWNGGEIPYEMAEDVIRMMLTSACVIFVNGEEKVTWLKQIFRGDKIFENIDWCPSLEKFNLLDYTNCQNHQNKTRKLNCARKNVIKLARWFDEYYLEEFF